MMVELVAAAMAPAGRGLRALSSELTTGEDSGGQKRPWGSTGGSTYRDLGLTAMTNYIFLRFLKSN